MKIERINRWFRRQGEWIIGKRWFVLGVFVLLVLFGLNGMRFLNIKTSWEDYFLEDDPMIVQTEEFKSIFGNDNFAAVLVESEDIFTRPNLELIRRLSNEMLDSMSYAEKITSLTDIEFMIGEEEGMVIEQIVPEEIPSDPEGLEEIKRKAYLKPNIANRLVSADGRLTWILLKLRPFPADTVGDKKGAGSPAEALTGQVRSSITSSPSPNTLLSTPREPVCPILPNARWTGSIRRCLESWALRSSSRSSCWHWRQGLSEVSWYLSSQPSHPSSWLMV